MDRQTKSLAMRALVQIKADPNARVLVMCGKANAAAALWKFLNCNRVKDCTYEAQTRTVTHRDGGKALIRHCDGRMNEYAGFEVSHVWVDEYVTAQDKEVMRCRIRSKLPVKEPIGVYTYYGRED